MTQSLPLPRWELEGRRIRWRLELDAAVQQHVDIVAPPIVQDEDPIVRDEDVGIPRADLGEQP